MSSFFNRKKTLQPPRASNTDNVINGKTDNLIYKTNGSSGHYTNHSRIQGERIQGSVNKTGGPPPAPQKPKLVFHCQLAHGSPTGLVSGFTNVKELYAKLADCYDIDVSEILFCTLNTHKVDMNRLLGGQIGLEDFIFVHKKGQAKEIELSKTDEALGLTITDNGAGYAFIKRVKEGSVVSRIQFIQVGDHIEKIDGKDLVGCRHYEVAKMLKEIPTGEVFTIRLVEPMRAGFANIGPRSDSRSGRKGSYGTGRETLRLRATGPAVVQEAPDHMIQTAIDKINNLLESFMGINDADLATQIWELGQDKKNPHDFVQAMDRSELAAFGFTDDFIFDLWGCIGDVKAGRIAMEMKF